MYHLIIYIFEFGLFVTSFFSKKVKKMWRGERDSFRILREKVDPEASYAWFHAASLGEFEQGRPIIEEYRRIHPDHKILLTFFSPSGYEVRKNYEGADIICYLPIDTPTNARRFLRTVRPCVAFFIKYEFWYNYMHILHHRSVPTYSVSSIFREEQIFFKWYGYKYRHVLRCFTHLFVQNERSRELLHGIGIDNVDVTGDTRFDRVTQIAHQSKTLPAVKAFCGERKVFIAGSSWLPDEQIFIPYFKAHPDWKLIIAPHVIDESHLSQIMSLLDGKKVIRYTQISLEEAKALPEANVLIIDCFGLLSSIYKYGTVAYVGGGFGVGIHNLPEAAVWNIPVIFGPNHGRFQEALELKTCGGGLPITNATEFQRIMDRFIADSDALQTAANAAGTYVNSRSGATALILKRIGYGTQD